MWRQDDHVELGRQVGVLFQAVNDVRGQARAGQALAQYADGAAGGLHADDLVAGGNKRR